MKSSDRTNQTIILNNGRKLGFAEYGPSTGQPVFHFHGSASSRLERPASESMLHELGIRFLSVDRPGHGLSDYQPDRRLLDWAKDVQQLADHLELEAFYVEGYSAGGPHALACAHQLPERVIAGALISGIAPMSRSGAFKDLPFFNRILAGSARWLPWMTKLIRRMMRRMALGDVEKTTRQLMASIPESDKRALYTSQDSETLVSTIREGFRTGSLGVAHDDILINRDWGFDLTGVKPRIDIWHGHLDVNVPIHAAQYLDNVLPHTRTHLQSDAGHFFIFEHWGEILAALISAN